jgi:hypothetical protein
MTEQKIEEAIAIIQKLEHDAAHMEASVHDPTVKKDSVARSVADKVLRYAVKRLSDINPDQAVMRVQELKCKHPELSETELIEKLIKAKCQKTAAVGAITSAASIIPGLGTMLSLTIGYAVDIRSTLKLQSELVLEIAEASGHQLTPNERNEVLLAVTGLSTGISRLSSRAVKGVSHKVGEMTAQKWLTKAIPAIGMAASASTNVLSTYIIGKRADAYFMRGPEALGDLKSNLRALSGVDERKIARWISESSRGVAKASANAGNSIVKGGKIGLGRVADAGRKAGKVISGTADKVAGTGKVTGKAIASGADKATGMISIAGRIAKDKVGDKAAKTINRITPKKKPAPNDDGEENDLKQPEA